MKGYFYITMNLVNSKFYYGSGTVGNESWYYGSNKHLDDSRKKYGDENFEHVPLKYFETREQAFDFEDGFLKLYKISKNPMSYNQKDDARGGRTWQDYTEDKRQIVLDKISKKSKESHKNSEKLKLHVYNMCKMKTKGRLDLPHTEESKRKIRESNIETWKDPELREIQRIKAIELNENGIIGMKGKKHKPESIEKIRKSNTGKKPSDEVRKIISERTKEGMSKISKEKKEEMISKSVSSYKITVERRHISLFPELEEVLELKLSKAKSAKMMNLGKVAYDGLLKTYKKYNNL